MPRIILLRHGESIDNTIKDKLSTKDTPLTKIGMHQAKKAGIFISNNYDIGKIFTSPYVRAYDTASIVANELKIDKIDILDELHEVDNGILAGLRRNEVELIPKIGKKISDIIDEMSTYDYVARTKHDKKYKSLLLKLHKLTGCETDEDVVLRIKKLYKYITNLKLKKDILLVSHSSFIHAMLGSIFNISIDGIGNNYANIDGKNISNCNISVINLTTKQLEIMLYTKYQ